MTPKRRTPVRVEQIVSMGSLVLLCMGLVHESDILCGLAISALVAVSIFGRRST